MHSSIDFIQAYGECLTDPYKRFMYFPLTKNASHKVKNILKDTYAWTEINEDTYEDPVVFLKNIHKFSIIRDPYIRWIYGFVDYVQEGSFEKFDNNVLTLLESQYWQEILTILLVSNTYDFNNYCSLQSKLFHTYVNVYELDLNEITYFYMGDTLGSSLTSYFKSYNMPNIVIDDKKENRIDKTNLIFKRVTDFLYDSKNDSYRQKIYNYLQPDYKFINLVTFYAG